MTKPYSKIEQTKVKCKIIKQFVEIQIYGDQYYTYRSSFWYFSMYLLITFFCQKAQEFNTKFFMRYYFTQVEKKPKVYAWSIYTQFLQAT